MDIGGPNRYGNRVYPDEGNPAPSRLTQQQRNDVDEAVNFLQNAGVEPTAERVADTTGHRLADIRAYMGEAGSPATGQPQQPQHFEEPYQDQGMTHDFEHAYDPPGGSAEGTRISPNGTQYGPPERTLGDARLSVDPAHERILLPDRQTGFTRPLKSGTAAFKNLPMESEQGMSDLMGLTRNLKEGSLALTGKPYFLSSLKRSTEGGVPGFDKLQRGPGGQTQDVRSEAGRKRARTMGADKLSEATQKRLATMGATGLARAATKRVETMGTDGFAEVAKKRKVTMNPERVAQATAKRLKSMDKPGGSFISEELAAERAVQNNNFVADVVRHAFNVQDPAADPEINRIMQNLHTHIGTGTDLQAAAGQMRAAIQQGLLIQDPEVHQTYTRLSGAFQHVTRNIQNADFVAAVVTRAFGAQHPDAPRIMQHLRNQITSGATPRTAVQQLHAEIQQGLQNPDQTVRQTYAHLAHAFQDVTRPRGG